MKYVFATALVDFKIAQVLKNPMPIKSGLFVTNNPAHLAGFMKPGHIVTIGSMETRPFTNGDTVLYRIDEFSDTSRGPEEVINFLRETQAFLTATWLKQDNSANCEMAFGFSQEPDGNVHSNSLALQYTDHSGGRKEISVDTASLSEICAFHATSFQGIKEQDFPAHTAFRNTFTRTDRAARFLQQARSSEDLGQKIANYCSFFEALLSTSASELSHQLAERVAFLLSGEPSERLRLFRQVKRAYSVRSKIVHGDVLSPGLISGLVEIAHVCDEVARALLLKILQDADLRRLFNSGSNGLLDAHMLNLIFGIETTTDLS
ncbi:HEPN domain-containing protein [Variovorax sp. J22R115]|uniref:HEPN domain-containing protein n=1 Tax=Variovorax sp. J22R115 TaxID=3053509 RepID=UPI0025786CFD|nr:HEPN domain-containing protein [Variovorax sp. J22R115]MDM0051404.1 HEPN domain-containing protein [Variovorax sp. J22R115]